MITVERKVHFARGARSRKVGRDGEAEISAGRVPRVTRLMALAIHLDQLIRDRAVADQAELARVGHVSRARLTQIMNLLHLAPDIQEELLFLPRAPRGRDAITERDLRPIAGLLDWFQQRRRWRNLIRNHPALRAFNPTLVAASQ